VYATAEAIREKNQHTSSTRDGLKLTTNKEAEPVNNAGETELNRDLAGVKAIDGTPMRPEWMYPGPKNALPESKNSPTSSSGLMCPCKRRPCPKEAEKTAEIRQPYHDGKTYRFKHYKIDPDSKYNSGDTYKDIYGGAEKQLPIKQLPPCKLLQ